LVSSMKRRTTAATRDETKETEKGEKREGLEKDTTMCADLPARAFLLSCSLHQKAVYPSFVAEPMPADLRSPSPTGLAISVSTVHRHCALEMMWTALATPAAPVVAAAIVDTGARFRHRSVSRLRLLKKERQIKIKTFLSTHKPSRLRAVSCCPTHKKRRR